MSLDFDETVLNATDVTPSFAKPDGSAYDFWVAVLNNDDLNPGSGGVDEGTVIVAAVFEFENACNFMPPHVRNEALQIDFEVRDDAPPGSTELRIVDGARATADMPPARNNITCFGEAVTPDVANSFVFINGRINVLPDGAIFIRGDTDGNQVVNLSDAQETLGYLFLSGENLGCLDAADANDDGRVNISDPVITLISLFLGGPELPAPSGEPGPDPTPDGLGCDSPSDLGR